MNKIQSLTDRQTDRKLCYPCNRLQSTNTQYYGIDLIKFFCAILIVSIHVSPFAQNLAYFNVGIQMYLSRIAVPFFFVSSGFLLFNKIDVNRLDQMRIRDYCFRILRLFGTWSILLFLGGNEHLWYLGALVVAVLLLCFLLNKKVKPVVLLIISSALYLIGLLGDSYYELIEPLKNSLFFGTVINGYEKVFQTTRNGVFMGLVFILMGLFFSWEKARIKMKTAVVFFILSMGLLFAEVLLLRKYRLTKDANMYVFLLPAVFFLFYIGKNIKFKPRMVFRKLRIIGVLIYFTHMLVKSLIDFGFSLLLKITGKTLYNQSIVFILVIVLSILLSWLIEFLSSKESLKWLRYLYS